MLKYIFSTFLLLVLSASMALAQAKPKKPASKAPATKKTTTAPKAQTPVAADPNFRKAPPKAGPAPKINLGTFTSTTLPNGLKVICVENRKLPEVNFQIAVDAPEILEGPAAGFIDMAGALLTTGTTSKTKAQIDQSVDFIGASLSSSGDGIFGSSLKKHQDKLLSIMADVLMNPTFPTEEFEKLKTQTLSGLAQEKTDPNAIARNVSQVLRNGTQHPYGEITTEKTVNNITLEMCKNYYKDQFQPQVSYFIATGDINLAEAKTLAQKYFGSWKKTKDLAATSYAVPAAPEKTKVAFVHKPGAVQSVISVTYPMEFKPGSADAAKVQVMNTIFGAYFNSRINQNLRETHGYTYGARSAFNPDKLVASFSAGGSVRNAVTDSSLFELFKEIKRLRTELPAEDEVETVRNVITGNFARTLEDPNTIARFALNTQKYKLAPNYYQTYLEQIAKVSPADVLATAQKYLKPDNAYVVVVGNKDQVSDKLGVFSADKKVYFYDAYGNPVEDKKAIPSDISVQKIMDNYLAALGGKEKLQKITAVKQVYSGTMMGQPLAIEIKQKTGGKLNFAVKMAGNTVQQVVVDGTKGQMSGMGQSQAIEGDELEAMKWQAIIFPELEYDRMGIKPEFKGIEDVNDRRAYAVETKRGQTVTTSYYDTQTGLKIKEVDASADGETTTEYVEFKEVDGIKCVAKMKQMMAQLPVPLELTATTTEMNANLPDTDFIIK